MSDPRLDHESDEELLARIRAIVLEEIGKLT